MQAMSRALVSAAALAVLLVGTLAAPAAEGSSTPQAQCRTAEVNPVTGHVLCIDPLGAAVEAPRFYLCAELQGQAHGVNGHEKE